MRKIFLIAGVLFIAKLTVAQVGIGTNQPHGSSILELNSTTKGFLPPRVALTATNAASPLTSPAAGLLVYNTATAGSAPNNVSPGYYYWNGTAWINLTGNGVPYSGAIGAVNLGAYDLTVNGLTVGRGGGTTTWNTALGFQVLNSNTSGEDNTAVGYGALKVNTASSNTAVGKHALNSNETGILNNAIGVSALGSNISGNSNNAYGYLALRLNTVGEDNNAFGTQALYNSTGSYNTAIGSYALFSNTTGGYNTSIGNGSLYYNTSGINNTALGYNTLRQNTVGTHLTAIGDNADVTVNNLTNSTVIGAGATVSTSNTIQLGNTSVTSVSTSGTLKAGAITYPNTDGTSGQLLITNGSGIASWASGSNAISTVGTITSGTWSATAIAVANGGTGAINSTGARTNLGATTVGDNFFTLANPNVVSFPRINSNNTVSALSASDLRIAIGEVSGTIVPGSVPYGFTTTSICGNFSTGADNRMHYYKIGNMVMFSGLIGSFGLSANCVSYVEFTPPIASAFSSSTDVVGTVSSHGSTGPVVSGWVSATTADFFGNPKIRISWTSSGTQSSAYVSFSGMYIVR